MTYICLLQDQINSVIFLEISNAALIICDNPFIIYDGDIKDCYLRLIICRKTSDFLFIFTAVFLSDIIVISFRQRSGIIILCNRIRQHFEISIWRSVCKRGGCITFISCFNKRFWLFASWFWLSPSHVQSSRFYLEHALSRYFVCFLLMKNS